MKGNKMKKTEILAVAATLAAALDYVLQVDSDGHKISTELSEALMGKLAEARNTLDFYMDTESVYTNAQAGLFDDLSAAGVVDMTGQYF